MIGLQVLDIELHNTRIWLKKTAVEGAFLFPFFEKTGRVRLFMLVLPEEPQVFMLPYAKGMIKVSPWKTIRVGLGYSELNAFGRIEKDQLKGLFHYDSHWVLDAERFSQYGAREIIQSTNCAAAVQKEAEKEVGHLRFSRNLSRLVNFAFRAQGLKVAGTVKAKKILEPLARAAAEKKKQDLVKSPPLWQLDPVWRLWNHASPGGW